jgi:hypothetical protein
MWEYGGIYHIVVTVYCIYAIDDWNAKTGRKCCLLHLIYALCPLFGPSIRGRHASSSTQYTTWKGKKRYLLRESISLVPYGDTIGDVHIGTTTQKGTSVVLIYVLGLLATHT